MESSSAVALKKNLVVAFFQSFLNKGMSQVFKIDGKDGFVRIVSVRTSLSTDFRVSEEYGCPRYQIALLIEWAYVSKETQIIEPLILLNKFQGVHVYYKEIHVRKLH